jgi:hypothetical protein
MNSVSFTSSFLSVCLFHAHRTFSLSISVLHTHAHTSSGSYMFSASLQSTLLFSLSNTHTHTHTHDPIFEPQTEGGSKKVGQTANCLVREEATQEQEASQTKALPSVVANDADSRCVCELPYS